MYTKPTAEIHNRYGTILPKNAAEEVEDWEHGFPVCIPIGGAGIPFHKPHSLRKDIPKMGRLPESSNSKIIFVDDFLPNLVDNNPNAFDSYYKLDNPLEISTKICAYSSKISRIVDDSYPTQGRSTRSTPFLHRGMDRRILKSHITKCVADIVENYSKDSNWSLEAGWQLSDKNIIASINSNVLKYLRYTRNLAGDTYHFTDGINAIRNRLLSEELGDLDVDYLMDLFDHQQALVDQGMLPYYQKSSDAATNELFAWSYIQLFFRSLNYKAPNITAVTQKILKRKPSRSLDINRRLNIDSDSFIPVNAKEKIVVVNSDGTLTGLPVNGLNVVTSVDSVGRAEEFELTSDLERSFFLSEADRHRALSMLGSNGRTVLSASSTFSTLVEFKNKLNLPRSSYYFFKLNPDRNTRGRKLRPFVSDFSYTYDLVESASEISDWITDKVSMGVYFIQHDDLLIDHFNSSKQCTLTFKDIDITSLGPKDNVDIPLYSRVMPTSIVIIPTDKTKYNLFNTRSRLNIFDHGKEVVQRLLEYTVIPDQRIGKSSVMDILAVNEVPGYKVTATFNGTEALYTDPVTSTDLPRKKTGIRILAEIIHELNSNYNLEGGLSWFDIISRMTQAEYYTSHFLDNITIALDYLERGGLGPKIFNDFQNDAVIKSYKTRLKSKINDLVDDRFQPIKGIPKTDRRTGRSVGDELASYLIVKPPTETAQPTLVDPDTITQSDTRDSATVIATNVFAIPDIVIGNY